MASRYEAPPFEPPGMAAYSTQLPEYIYPLENEYESGPESRTIAQTVNTGALFPDIVKKIGVVGRIHNYSFWAFRYDCDTGVEIVVYTCPMNRTESFVRDGTPLPDTPVWGQDVLSRPDSASYRIVITREADCPPCPGECVGGCSNYRWEQLDIINLTGEINVFPASNIAGDDVIDMILESRVYAIIAGFDPELYDIVVNDEVKEFYIWRTAGGDNVALIPKGFRLNSGDRLRLRVKGPPVSDYLLDYKVRFIDFLTP